MADSTGNKISYAVVDLAPAADVVVTAQECDFIGAIVLTVLSAHTVDIEAGTGGDRIGAFVASSAVGIKVDGMGVRVSAITVAGNASSTGILLVAYRLVSDL